jgi:serine/threonine protein kinase/predicted Zn-dependent protease
LAKVEAEGDEAPSVDPEIAAEFDQAMARFPHVGDIFLGFRLIHELGRGGFGRVFLAQQVDLANRLVALKVSVDLRGESQRQAQLQHTNIMPLYSEHNTSKLHAVCMPFLGSTTLADICKALRTSNILPTSGKHLVSTLYNRQTTVNSGVQSAVSEFSIEEVASEVEDVYHGKLPRIAKASTILAHIENLTYEDAILWIGVRLAAGLAHAHERGIIHRDLKPANILLTDDGEPMILDFNLAEDTKCRSSATAKVGGTLPYMSPEQLAMYADPTVTLDGRSDIYSLGLILFQLLTGRFAFPLHRGRTSDILPVMIKDRNGPIPELRSHNPAITPAMEAIIQRCLQPNPALRYSCAEELVEDLERQQKNLPLKYTKEPSLLERACKWARRNPKLASPQALLASIAAVGLIITGTLVYWSYQHKERQLDHYREVAVEGYHHGFSEHFQQAESLLSTENPEELKEGIQAAQTALAYYGVLDDAKWGDKPNVKYLPPEDRKRLKEDIGELGFLLARTMAFQPGEQVASAEAQRYHKLASDHLGAQDQFVVALQRSELQGRPTVEEFQILRLKLENAPPSTGRSAVIQASDHMAHARYNEAMKVLVAALERDRNDFGCWYLRAQCHAALKEEADAVACLGHCIALRPSFARAHHLRATILYSQRKNLPQAKADLDQALKLQPSLLAAYIDRALVLHAMNRHKEALEDLDWALSCPDAPKRVYFIRAQVRQALKDKKGAEQDRAEGLKQEPTDAVSWVTRGIVQIKSNPKAALEDFVQAEKVNPRYWAAIMNQSYVLGESLKKPEEAIKVLDHLLEMFPDLVDARVAKAIYSARLGKADLAVEEIKKALGKTPSPDTLYRAGCVYALLSEKKPEYEKQSLHYLSEALKRGWGFDCLERDSDLNLLRKHEEFSKIIQLVKTLQKWSQTK